MDIICEVDRFSHDLNQTIIDPFEGLLAPNRKINESAIGLHNKCENWFDLEVVSSIARKTDKYVL